MARWRCRHICHPGKFRYPTAFINAGRSNRRSADGHINHLPVATCVDTARSLAKRNRRHNFMIRRIDHRKIARSLVSDIDALSLRDQSLMIGRVGGRTNPFGSAIPRSGRERQLENTAECRATLVER